MNPEDIELIVDADGSEGDCLLFEVLTPDGSLQGLAEVETFEGHLTVKGLHIGGDEEIHWGWSKLRKIGRLIQKRGKPL
ncbi:hypothetical protein, partial [Roseibium sp. RKSG952]|uniref:hypothetical protein n=1 Tax=Roseibium sp. RKSG952 TaxID=2529384 RepID=UPI0012BB4A59